MKTICISNHKGGVGKSVSTINIGAGIANRGFKVLLIDLDPQSNLSQGLGVVNAERNIYGAMREDYPLTPVQVQNNLFVVPSTLDLSGIEVELFSAIGGQTRLRDILSEMKESFDYVLIDTPPSLGLLSVNAFAASDEVIVPLTPEYFSVQGIVKLTEIVAKVKRSLNPNLNLTGVLITKYNKQKIIQREICEKIKQSFGDKMFDTRIRFNISLEESPARQVDVFTYDPGSNGAKDYGDLVDEFLAREKCVIM